MSRFPTAPLRRRIFGMFLFLRAVPWREGIDLRYSYGEPRKSELGDRKSWSVVGHRTTVRSRESGHLRQTIDDLANFVDVERFGHQCVHFEFLVTAPVFVGQVG